MVIERCPACGDPSASPPAEVFCVRCATEDYAITEQRLKVARLEEQLAGAVARGDWFRDRWALANGVTVEEAEKAFERYGADPSAAGGGS